MPKDIDHPAPRKPRRLTPAELRWTCDPSKYDLDVPESESRLIGIIGQERAIRAMKMGIELYSPGYNVFVCGITGTGRTSTVKRILDNIKSSCPLPLDRAYVHNFRQPERPSLVVLPRGRSREFRKDIERFRKNVGDAVPRLLESEEHNKRRERIIEKHEQEGDRLIEKFERRVEKEGFALKRVREGAISRPELFPMIAGQAVAVGDLERLQAEKKLTESQFRLIQKRYVALHTELESVARASRTILQHMESSIATAERDQVKNTLEEPAKAIGEKHGNKAIEAYLADAIEHIAEKMDLFRPPAVPPVQAAEGAETKEDILSLLDVNVLLDNAEREHCPVVIENLPTYRRLFGYFDRDVDRSGHWTSDYRKIRGGSFLLADGGYLVLNAEDVFQQRGVWQNLKRSLVNRVVEIHEEDTPFQVPVSVVTPEPIPVNVKVILIGDTRTYHFLHQYDTDFRKIFKVLADFDYEMDNNRKNLRQYGAFIGKMCQDEGLAAFEPGALAAVAEYGARQAGRQGKLTARFGEISDLLREADYWRRREGGATVSARHIRTARDEADRRSGMWEEKVREMVTTGRLLIEVKGARVGQVNGLTVQDTGAHAYGMPARITASAAPGDTGIINIEREAHLSGNTHDKGVLIIGGYFRHTFGVSRPVTFSASLAFEQSYGGIDGDSASSTEIYALLSALSGLPIDQGIAVTGSVDQKGNIQPVGGIHHKIEGFFAVCRARGLTGQQGVIMPRANVADLMLREEVVDAVRKRKFHVYPITTIDEGIEILTGTAAGVRGRDGSFPPGTVHARVERRLVEMAEASRRQAPPKAP
ncbi:MAG: AAA family ATPase [Acidobacteria bacterium]|nr:AAA family ATPase [Acidobacteriota bacterium]